MAANNQTTCSAAKLDGTCPDPRDEICTGPSSSSGGIGSSAAGLMNGWWNDKAVTSGECKAYGGALSLVLPPQLLNSNSNLEPQVVEDCKISVSMEVNQGGTVDFCGGGSSSSASGATCTTSAVAGNGNDGNTNLFTVCSLFMRLLCCLALYYAVEVILS